MAGPATGRCLCGAVRFRVAEHADTMGTCHCDSCRRWTGGMPHLSVQLRKADISFDGAANIIIYRSSDHAETANRCICPGAPADMNGIRLISEEDIDAKPNGYALAGDHETVTAAAMEVALKAHLERLGAG